MDGKIIPVRFSSLLGSEPDHSDILQYPYGFAEKEIKKAIGSKKEKIDIDTLKYEYRITRKKIFPEFEKSAVEYDRRDRLLFGGYF